MVSATIITGFLGSGKTTLLNRLLKHPAAAQGMVLVNEFGEIGIDHLVVAAPAENVRLLANGCLCCQTRGELVDTLADLATKRTSGELPAFELLFIETTGLADPVPLVHALAADERLGTAYRLERVVTVVDAVHVHALLACRDEARKQVALADTLLVSKTDLVDAAELPELRAALRRINPAAGIFVSLRGETDMDRMLARRPADEARRWTETPRQDSSAAHLHTGDIGTFSVAHERPVSEAGLATWLSMAASLKGAELLRIKGIANVAGEPWIVDVVQSVVHAPRRLDAWPSSDRRTRLVFIARGLARETIEGTFRAFELGDSLPGTRGFDARSYERFREVADAFVGLEQVIAPRRAPTSGH